MHRSSEKKKISVIMPVYNAAPYIQQAVASALQFKEVCEILLIEDGSTDRSLEICEELAGTGSRVKVIQHSDKKNHGAGASRNLGLAQASCELIAFLDADDHYLPNRFEQEHVLLELHPALDGVYGAIGVHYHDEVGKLQFERFSASQITTVSMRVDPDELFFALLFKPGFGHFSLDALTLRKRSLEKIPHFFNEDLRLHQDTEFITRASYYLALAPGSIEEPVTLRGVHRANRITTNKDPSASNIKLYTSLCNWATQERLPTNIQHGLREKYVLWRCRSIRTFNDKVKWGREMINYRHLLKRRIADAFFSSIFGDGSLISRISTKLAIRIFAK
ncbi:MAG: glycosyltransferase family 2 protein [Flavobacteriales bacterium]|nr:glycosyltransferase family 2 protein [Flavobacteriales bacterium]